MDSRRGLSAILAGLGLVLCGLAGGAAWQQGLWGLLTGAALAAVWIGALNWAAVIGAPSLAHSPAATRPEAVSSPILSMLLDAAPTPLVAIEGSGARALNRAARALFATDASILPAPPQLLETGIHYLRHERRNWRIDRVEVVDAGGARTVVALIDIEQEERVAEARATAELIQILGHELLNGLAPIVSLAESGVAAAERDPALLSEILGTLARRAEGLQRFTESYRALARLPEPQPSLVSLDELADDLARLFTGRWPEVSLTVDVPDDLSWPLDRDQASQAIWALLQNAAEAIAEAEAPQVRLCAYQAEGGLAIEVQDNGDGIAPGLVHRIFRPFHTTKPQGTGIGLSLARQIAHAHGGTLTLELTAKTKFRLFLPER
jgi:signal transduction histidine kinase